MTDENKVIDDAGNECILAPPSIEDEFTRTNYTPNAKGLSEEAIKQRDVDTAKMMELYPKINPLWADMIWNFCHNKPDEAKRVMESKEWEGRPELDRNMRGGTMKTASVLDKSEIEAS